MSMSIKIVSVGMTAIMPSYRACLNESGNNILIYLNAKAINTIVRAFRITNISTVCNFVAGGLIKTKTV